MEREIERICLTPNCNESNSANFGKHPTTKDNLQTKCKKCINKIQKEKRDSKPKAVDMDFINWNEDAIYL